MTSLQDLAVRIETACSTAEAALTGAAPAVLREIDDLLVRLADGGESGRIDLKSLPLSPADLEWLTDALGTGEVHAAVETMGNTEVFETAVHGVWRVRHMDEGGGLTADFIEVTQVPEILKTHRADIEMGRAQLREQLERLQKFDEGDGHVR